MACELRACCKRPVAAFISTPEAPRTHFRDGSTAPLVATIEDPPPDEAIAYHEAGHALADHVYGSLIERVTIAGQPCVRADLSGLSNLQRITMLMCGPAAMAAYRGWTTTLFAHELDEYFERVDQIVFGNCDECQAGLAATVAGNRLGLDRTSIFREGERRANELVHRRAVWMAIRALAAELMREHTLSGKRAHSVLEPFIKFGELANAKED